MKSVRYVMREIQTRWDTVSHAPHPIPLRPQDVPEDFVYLRRSNFDYIWEDLPGLNGGENPEYNELKQWLKDNVSRYYLDEGDVLGEIFIRGIWIDSENAILLRLKFGL